MLINDARRLYILGARSAAYLAGLMGYYFKMMFDNVIIVDANSTSETLEQIYDISDKDGNYFSKIFKENHLCASVCEESWSEDNRTYRQYAVSNCRVCRL